MKSSWTCRLDDGQRVSASVGWPSDPVRPVFVWYTDGELEPQPAMLERGFDGAPARVLRQRIRGTQVASEDVWVFDPDLQELDAAGEAVRMWVDSLTIEDLLAISRRMAGNDLKHAAQRVEDARRVVAEAERRALTSELTVTALELEHGVARDAALRWVPDWTGCAEELRAAAEDLVVDWRSLASG